MMENTYTRALRIDADNRTLREQLQQAKETIREYREQVETLRTVLAAEEDYSSEVVDDLNAADETIEALREQLKQAKDRYYEVWKENLALTASRAALQEQIHTQYPDRPLRSGRWS